MPDCKTNLLLSNSSRRTYAVSVETPIRSVPPVHHMRGEAHASDQVTIWGQVSCFFVVIVPSCSAQEARLKSAGAGSVAAQIIYGPPGLFRAGILDSDTGPLYDHVPFPNVHTILAG